jgi:riboflavin kinase/FMN adenylyltransferase
MTQFINFNQIKTPSTLPLVIGFFDGLHKGHLKLFRGLNKGKFNILTFVNVPNKNNNLLYTDPERISDLKELEPANIFILDLHKHNLLSMAFVYKLLQKLKPSYIIVGADFKFGKQRHGDVDQLKLFFKTKIVKIDSKYKTTNIKKYILEGNISSANKLLMKPYILTGFVTKGKRMGHKLGYPTANVKLSTNTIQPKTGSYKAYTYLNNVKYPSAVFVRDHLLETHIFNFNNNIYGKVISVEFIKYHQDMNQINNFSDLKKIINKKVQSIKSSF